MALLISLGVSIQFANAQISAITIRPDGSLEPHFDSIEREGNIYFIKADLNFSINIQKGDIILDGTNHSLQGPGSDKNFIGLTLMASNVTIRNLRISGWRAGIYGAFNNNTIANNAFSNNYQAIAIYANNYIVTQNRISDASTGILVDSNALQPQGDNNHIIRNQITNNSWALDILNSNGTFITENNITDNNVILTLATGKIYSTDAGFHLIYLNNFINNKQVLHVPFGGPFASGAPTVSPAGNWDNGTLGNYWSDYKAKYPNYTELYASGTADLPYLIEESTTWESNYSNGTLIKGTAVFGQAADNHPLLNPITVSNGLVEKPQHSPVQSTMPSKTPDETLSPSLSTSSPSSMQTPQQTQPTTSAPVAKHSWEFSNVQIVIIVAITFLSFCMIAFATRRKKIA